MRVTTGSILLVALTILLSLAIVAAYTVYAQDGGDEDSQGEREVAGAGVGDLGLADEAPAGYWVLYTFTGVGNDTDGLDVMATAVHCTNYGAADVSVIVQLFNNAGDIGWETTYTLASNQTRTFVSQPTLIFGNETNIGTTGIQQGSGRVLGNASTIICTAQLVDPDSSQPSFLAKLPLYDANGYPIHWRRVLLPAILKEA